MSELKPCPFCGSVPDIEPIEDCEYINCSNLDCIDGVYCLTTKQWNTRPIEDELRAEITRLKEENHALDQINRDIQTAAAHLDEVLADLARRDEIIARLKEDAERLRNIVGYPDEQVAENNDSLFLACKYCGRIEVNKKNVAYIISDTNHAPDCPITLHRALMKELE